MSALDKLARVAGLMPNVIRSLESMGGYGSEESLLTKAAEITQDALGEVRDADGMRRGLRMVAAGVLTCMKAS